MRNLFIFSPINLVLCENWEKSYGGLDSGQLASVLTRTALSRDSTQVLSVTEMEMRTFRQGLECLDFFLLLL